MDVDRAIEALIVPSFLRWGYELRRRSYGWQDPPRLDGRTVVLTGATRGIGAAAASRIVELGAALTLVARSAESGTRARDQLRRIARPGQRVELVLADLGDLTAVARAASEIRERHGTIDVLAHNAGGLSRERIIGASGVEQTIASQVVAVQLLTDLLAGAVSAAKGRVLVMTSGGMYTTRHDLDALRAVAAGRGAYDGRLPTPGRNALRSSSSPAGRGAPIPCTAASASTRFIPDGSGPRVWRKDFRASRARSDPPFGHRSRALTPSSGYAVHRRRRRRTASSGTTGGRGRSTGCRGRASRRQRSTTRPPRSTRGAAMSRGA